MKILIDIKHPAQLNLFKGLSQELSKEHWDVTICYLRRGKLPKIIESEYAGFRLIPIGSSSGTKWSILWNGNIRRSFLFMGLLRKNAYNICVAASSIPLAFACKLSGVPVIQFYDDPERARINAVNALLSNQVFFPPIVSQTKKVSVFNCLKEWSYLSPRRFQPDAAVLRRYDLLPHRYLFVREVSNKSFNYFSQPDGIIAGFSAEIHPCIPVVLSLEDKSLRKRFPKHWIILEEPVEGIHSLMYWSKLVLSSGDSMAREGAMLGLPSIYCGIRKMEANNLLIQPGLLKHLPGKQALGIINQTAEDPFDTGRQEEVRGQLLENWEDLVVFMKEKINHYKN
jgi:predicted glycosyltransferase